MQSAHPSFFITNYYELNFNNLKERIILTEHLNKIFQKNERIKKNE